MNKTNELKDQTIITGYKLRSQFLRLKLWYVNRLHTRRLDAFWDLMEHEALICDIKRLKPLTRKRKRHTICILDVKGQDIKFEFVEAKDDKIKINGRYITLPEVSYYTSNPKKLGNIKLKGSIPLYCKEIKSNGDLTISPTLLTKTHSDIELSGKTQSQILDESVLSSFLSSMQITKTQLFMYGSVGVVCWEITKIILKIIQVSLEN